MSELKLKTLFRNQKHPFHIVDPSPWPFIAALGAFFIVLGLTAYLHFYNKGFVLFLFGFFLFICTIAISCRDVIREATFEGHHTLYVQKGLKLGMILFILGNSIILFDFFFSIFCILQEIIFVPEAKAAGIQFAASPDPDINKKNINSPNNAPSTAASNWDFWTIVQWVAIGVGILGAFAGVVYCIRNGMPDFDFGNKGGGRSNPPPPTTPPPASTTSPNNGTDAVATAVVETVTPEITAAAQAVGETAAKAVQVAVEVMVDPVTSPEAGVIQEVVVQGAEVVREAAPQVPPQPAAPVIGGNGDPLRGGYFNQSDVEAILNTVIIESPDGYKLTPKHFGAFSEHFLNQYFRAAFNDPSMTFIERENIIKNAEENMHCLLSLEEHLESLEKANMLSRELKEHLIWGKEFREHLNAYINAAITIPKDDPSRTDSLRYFYKPIERLKACRPTLPALIK